MKDSKIVSVQSFWSATDPVASGTRGVDCRCDDGAPKRIERLSKIYLLLLPIFIFAASTAMAEDGQGPPISPYQACLKLCALLAGVTLYLLAIFGHTPMIVLPLLIVTVLLLWFAMISIIQVLGKWVLFAINSPKSDLPVWNVGVGGILFFLSALIPGLGWLSAIVLLAVGIGGIVATPFARSALH